MITDVSRPALRYFGGKFRLANRWIIPQFPPHICYVEPFGGGCNVLMCKDPSYNEVYNDLDGEVVNFFRILRDRPDDLLRAISLTPYAREEQRAAFETVEDELERARRLYVRCWQSHGGGRTQWRSGWRYEKGATRGKRVIDDWNDVDHLEAIVARLKNVQIECDDALRVIDRFDSEETLFYCDPPYLASTRSIRWRDKAYACEIDENYHRQLAEKLATIKGMAIVSGKPCELYDALYPGWMKLEKTCPTDFQGTTVEALWISPRAQKNQQQMRIL